MKRTHIQGAAPAGGDNLFKVNKSLPPKSMILLCEEYLRKRNDARGQM